MVNIDWKADRINDGRAVMIKKTLCIRWLLGLCNQHRSKDGYYRTDKVHAKGQSSFCRRVRGRGRNFDGRCGGRGFFRGHGGGRGY